MNTFFEWLGTTGWSIALLESIWVWSLVESTHVLTLTLFAGTAVMMDLRFLGVAFKRVPISEFTNRMLPWTRGAFLVMVVTGFLLLYSNPLRYYHNIFFRIKIGLMVLAGLNVWWFHARTHRKVVEWDHDPIPPRAVRIAGGMSIFMWAFIIITGRMIAYNWFDCDIQPQSDFVNWASGCVLPTE